MLDWFGNIKVAIGFAIPVFSIAVIGTVTATELPRSQQMSTAVASSWRLDSIPPVLFQKMFGDHKLFGSPGLAWKKQRVITVAFKGGSDELYKLIEQTANEWTDLGGQLSLSFKDGTGQYRRWNSSDRNPAANIRVAFDSTGYWSLLGVLARNVDPGDATMNFGEFPQELRKYFHGDNAAEWKTSYAHTTILHEFGHALGLSHEHFNQQCQKDLKIDSIIAHLMSPPNNWNEEQARFNMDAQYYVKILARQAGSQESKLMTSLTTDQSSVMLYAFPADYYHGGDKSVCMPKGDHGQIWPTALSAGDKQFYLENYRVISSPFSAASSIKGGKR